MRFSGTDRDDEGPWFELGKIEVTSTVFVLVVWTFTLFVFAAEPVAKPVMTGMAVIPEKVAFGEVWRVFTWPWSHAGFGLFDLIGAALFYLFGTDLEKQVGRRRFAVLLASTIVIIGLTATVLSLLLPGDTVISDLDLLFLTILMLYIAENPFRPFFFGIPAWVIGAVIASIELINDAAYRDWIRLLSILVAGALIALVSKRLGLLSNYDVIPEVGLPGRERRARKRAERASPGSGRRSGGGGGAPKRSGRLWGSGSQDAEIVEMPTGNDRSRSMRSVVPDDLSADDVALDLLLDKISEGGMDALSTAEREQLSELRSRRRGRSST